MCTAAASSRIVSVCPRTQESQTRSTWQLTFRKRSWVSPVQSAESPLHPRTSLSVRVIPRATSLRALQTRCGALVLRRSGDCAVERGSPDALCSWEVVLRDQVAKGGDEQQQRHLRDGLEGKPSGRLPSRQGRKSVGPSLASQDRPSTCIIAARNVASCVRTGQI